MNRALNAWPFDVWLRMAVKRFGLSPSEFWALPLREWLVLMQDAKTPNMGRTRLNELINIYPDTPAKGAKNGSAK